MDNRYLCGLKIYGQAGWFAVRKAFVRFTYMKGDKQVRLSADSVLVLSYLIWIAGKNAEDESNDDFQRNEGWFKCGARRICKLFDCGVRTQKRTMGELQDAGLIQTEMRAENKLWRRWVFVNIEEVWKKEQEVHREWAKIEAEEDKFDAETGYDDEDDYDRY